MQWGQPEIQLLRRIAQIDQAMDVLKALLLGFSPAIGRVLEGQQLGSSQDQQWVDVFGGHYPSE